ncbi:MAG: aminopeptidase [Fimbriimonadales bacterium]|jgi:aminopeptidase|nr:aminopeptidase [Fimbriimonadales bacterium]GBC90863.1 Aminopeptidase T [bacterium HR14]CUU04887.1 Leucyl aminopeptidase (aminopeptidase T) [Armatimonadetes bacterium GBS]CUU34698.1 Leucyl aminopeptidase (aminopeptidase T) [Armatimonadetes bacterium GXS]
MIDARWQKLADVLVHHSVRVQPGDKVLIEAFDMPPDFVALLMRTISDAGGIPIAETKTTPVLRALYQNATEEQIRFIAGLERQRMEGVQGYIGLRGTPNFAEMSDVPQEKMRLIRQLWWVPVHQEVRVPRTRWVVLRWPTVGMAQAAGMSTEAFEDFYFRVCTLDYAKMERDVQPLVELMERTREVHIKGPGTDLRFSIEGIGVVPCYGLRNIPDGECFTCPVRDSVEGEITINTNSVYEGNLYRNIRFRLKQGKIVEATCADDGDRPGAGNPRKLNAILDSDEGARYIGEWSLGFNPYILHPMNDTLFDEKIAGSFHFTPGNAYQEADNGNRSQIHWDLVVIQRPEYGGGEIYFDGRLVRKDGQFVLPELQALNYPTEVA